MVRSQLSVVRRRHEGVRIVLGASCFVLCVGGFVLGVSKSRIRNHKFSAAIFIIFQMPPRFSRLRLRFDFGLFRVACY